MKRLGKFDLSIGSSVLPTRSSKKKMGVEVLVDLQNTTVLLDCSCCENLLANKLPGGVLIPIATAMKTFFKERGMRNLDVRVSGVIMRRTYQGVIDESHLKEMKRDLELVIASYSKKKKR